MRFLRPVLFMAVCLLVFAPAPARAQQAINLSFGGFVPTGEDARSDGDVLIANRDILSFDVKDFNSGSIGIEWLLPFGEFFEAGVGAAFTSRTVPTVYSDFVNRDGSEIEQDLKLRIAPVTATVRVLPFGRSRAVQPYLGGGVGFFSYRYSEVGDFVDFTDRSVFRDRFVASGTKAGPVALAGIRFPIGDRWSLGGEVRYQKASADLSEEFLGSTLDLGGFHYLGTLRIKF
ncbi:MAG TPA: outer membrane beta-barrel protein [Vicinamibacterales bacterium]|nr:outer membrane beta-barrel protein [Vicinamibacterales bacterium]